ncbi:MAG: hypothetical protein ACKVP2_01330 [Burkholderiales bacterium]
MKTTKRISLRAPQSGVMLLEALIGILIFSLGILAMVGMQVIGIKVATESRDRTEASNLASQLIGEMWTQRGANNVNLPGFAYAGAGAPPAALATWMAQVNAAMPDAANFPPIVTIAAPAWTALNPAVPVAALGTQITVTVRWKGPSDTTTHQYSMAAYIN